MRLSGRQAIEEAGMGSRRALREAEFADFAAARMHHLYRTAWMLCGDRQRAEDLVQETLIKVYSRWGSRIEHPLAYARTTLTRTWIDQSRRRGHHEPPIADVPDHGVVPEDHALRLTLLAALDELDPVDRAVVVLRHLEDQSTDEVGRLLGLSPGAVRKRLMRALGRMRAHLEPTSTDLHRPR
jgi:RNA polymerase sigma-70 factor (sigma-E family)